MIEGYGDPSMGLSAGHRAAPGTNIGIPMPTSEELLELATRCAEKLEEEGYLRHVPSFSDAEEQCETEYENLLQAIHEDELFAPVDIQRQEHLVEQIASALPEDKRTLIVELADNHARHVWLQQEGAYHLGLAVGRRLRKV